MPAKERSEAMRDCSLIFFEVSSMGGRLLLGQPQWGQAAARSDIPFWQSGEACKGMIETMLAEGDGGGPEKREIG